MAIYYINLRHQVSKILTVIIIWTSSLLVLILNRLTSPQLFIAKADSILTDIPTSRVIFWSVLLGIFMGLLTGVFEYFFSSKTFSRLKGSQLIVLKSLAYLLFFIGITALAYYGTFASLEVANKPDTYWGFFFSESAIPSLGHLILTSILVNAYIYVERIVGRSRFANILSGQYQDPQKRNLIFMFIDLKGSTSLAEKWGQYKTAKFFQDYYGDLSELIYPYRGSLYQYVGDEAVITWDMKEDNEKNIHCIDFFYAFKDTIEKKRDYYLNEYGIIPEFKAGLHCGQVTVSEIGKYQIDIAYHGDVLNTTARMTSECRIIGKDLLVSQVLIDNLVIPPKYNVQNVGEAQFRGKELYTNLFYIWPSKG